MAPYRDPRIRLRFAATRVKRLRLAHRFTKAELARRAFLTTTEYSYFEPPAGRRLLVATVPQAHAERLAIALGTTVAYLATGATNAAAVPPNHPSHGMLKELEAERRSHANSVKRYEKWLGEARRERDALQQLVDAMGAWRQRDITYLAELASEVVVDEDHLPLALLEATKRMQANLPARPDPERDAADAAADADDDEDDDDDVDPCPKGDPDCETGDDGSCHDSCEPPRGPVAEYFGTEDR